MTTEPETPPKRVRKPRKLHRHVSIGIWMVLTNLMLGVFILYVALSLTERALPAPGWVADRLEAEMNESLPNGRLSIGRVAMRVNEAGLPALQATNLAFYDGGGGELVRLNRVSVRFSPLAMIRGEVRPRELEVAGAQITIRRRVDGEFDLSLGTPDSEATGSVTELLDRLDALFAEDFMADTTELNANDLTISLLDARSGRVWQITDGTLRVANNPDGLDISVFFDVFNGTEDLAETELSILTERDSSAATIGTRFENAAAADIALQAPALAFLGVVDAPISGAVRSHFHDNGALDELIAALEIGQGALRPSTADKPLNFESASAYLGFDPARQKITFDQIAVHSDQLDVETSGHAYLTDFNGAWPRALLGQFQLSGLRYALDLDAGQGMQVDQGATDVRVRLDPFSVEFGQFTFATDTEVLRGKAVADTAAGGWNMAVDAELPEIGIERLVEFWPEAQIPATRDWLSRNISAGTFHNVRFSARRDAPGQLPFELGFTFRDATIRMARGMPLLQGASGYGRLTGPKMVFVMESGFMQTFDGAVVDLAGSVFRSDNLDEKPSTANLQLKGRGTLPAVLEILSRPPVLLMRDSDLGTDFARGEVTFDAQISYPMKPKLAGDEIRYAASGTVRDAASDALVPQKTVTSRALTFHANNDSFVINGPAQIGAVEGRISWSPLRGPENRGRSRLTGKVELSADTIDEFSLGLPDGMVTGQALADVSLDLARGVPPFMRLTSSLDGAVLQLPQIGWRKPASEAAAFSLEASLASKPAVSDIRLATSGLDLSGGALEFDEGGIFRRATFENVRVGDWLTAPLSLVSRGPGASPAVVLEGGTLKLGQSLPGSRGGEGSPISVNLDRVEVSSSIALTEVTGDLNSSGGLNGRFAARINGGTRLRGQMEAVPGGVAVRLQSERGGQALRDAGIFSAATGGLLEVVLQPSLRQGVLYRGQMRLTETNVQRAPVLTELLSAVSVVGLLDQIRGAGIVFDAIEAVFDLTPDEMILHQSSAVGPSLGVSLDGRYDFDTGTLDMQGVISPVYFLNALGQIISPRKGEGLLGFNFRLNGAADAPSVQVNPLSILTPGAIRDIFRKPDTDPG